MKKDKLRLKLRNHPLSLSIPLLLLLSFLLTPTGIQADTPPPPPQPELNAFSTIFIPVVQNPHPLFVGDIEFTQAVQNLSRPVPLVAGRPTVARVYLRTRGSNQVSNVWATLKAYRNGNYIGEKTLNSGTAFPQSTSLDAMRASASGSLNFSLEPAWIAAGATSFVVELRSSPNGSADATYSTLAQFNAVPALKIVAVPIEIYDQFDGQTYPAADTSYLQEAIFRMYPVPAVNVTVHSIYHYDAYAFGDYSSFSDLLDQISNLKSTEHEPASTVYYGVIPLTTSSGSSWIPQYGSYYAGIGFVDYRAAIGIADGIVYNYHVDGGDTASHEIGHNLGRLHSPGCGASNYDRFYPYANGVIGQYGFKVSEMPSQVVVSNSYNDIMNYCGNQWISDYTYLGLYQDQKASAAQVSLPEQDTVFVRATMDTNGEFDLAPLYFFNSSPDAPPESSEYAIQLLDETGQVIAQQPVSLLHAEEGDIVVNSVSARVPLPAGKTFTSLKLVKNNTEQAARSLAPAAQTQVLSEASIHQNADRLTLDLPRANQPALIRYTADGGITWTTLRVDYTDSLLEIDPHSLPDAPLQFQIIYADGAGSYTLDWAP